MKDEARPLSEFEQRHLRESLTAALREAAERAANADRARAAAITEIGELLRRDQAAGDLVGLDYAQHLTDLPKQVLTQARDDDSAWRDLGEIAGRARIVDDDHGDQTALHARLPYLAGWHRAAEHLQRQHQDAYWKARGGFDPWATDGPEDAPGLRTLLDEYNANLAAYSNGDPPYLRWLLQSGRASAGDGPVTAVTREADRG
ncbi:hypothetical protein [Micromonospora aurantiaca (nom. illeg.)]|uniref:hypothetical protein n=1 Tax=Micromonospora aurantiaca (nom. illeg.) TaxID=47850 RepID=UPI003401D697